MSRSCVLEISELTKELPDGRVLLDRVSFTFPDAHAASSALNKSVVPHPDEPKPLVLFVTGPSGTGKSTLLRSIAALDATTEGHLRLHTSSASSMSSQSLEVVLQSKKKTRAESDGPSEDDSRVVAAAHECSTTQWRTEVLYIPQSRIDVAGSPLDLFETVKTFGAQTCRVRAFQDPVLIGENLGLNEQLMSTPWKRLSGGEAQRAALAIGLATNPSVLLLDEPTASLDPAATKWVEQSVRESGIQLVLWVSHDEAQRKRVGGHELDLYQLQHMAAN